MNVYKCMATSKQSIASFTFHSSQLNLVGILTKPVSSEYQLYFPVITQYTMWKEQL